MQRRGPAAETRSRTNEPSALAGVLVCVHARMMHLRARVRARAYVRVFVCVCVCNVRVCTRMRTSRRHGVRVGVGVQSHA